jgi:hypothetical protein
MERPDFLNQTREQKREDGEKLKKLKEEALEQRVAPSKDALRLDFIERSIEEVRRHLRVTDDVERAGLEARLKFLLDERERPLT